jgi:hypothetical protein
MQMIFFLEKYVLFNNPLQCLSSSETIYLYVELIKNVNSSLSNDCNMKETILKCLNRIFRIEDYFFTLNMR